MKLYTCLENSFQATIFGGKKFEKKKHYSNITIFLSGNYYEYPAALYGLQWACCRILWRFAKIFQSPISFTSKFPVSSSPVLPPGISWVGLVASNIYASYLDSKILVLVVNRLRVYTWFNEWVWWEVFSSLGVCLWMVVLCEGDDYFEFKFVLSFPSLCFLAQSL